MKFDPAGKDDMLMDSASDIYRVIHAGKGQVTLVAPSNNAHSYKFLAPTNIGDFDEGTIFVYVLHENHTMYVGKLTEGGVILTRNSRFCADTEAYKGANYIARMASSQELTDKTPMRLYNNGKCCKCGRSLTSTDTRKIGIGNKCLKKYEIISAKVKWDGNWRNPTNPEDS